MTTLNITITPKRAVISQDHGLYHYNEGELGKAKGGTTTSLEDAAKSAFIGDGIAPNPEGMELVQKVTCWPERRLLIGAAGAYAHTAQWPAYLAEKIPDGDVSDIADLVPNLLRELIATVPSNIGELVVVHAGWSAAEGRVIGYAYDRSNNFEPVRLDRGHTLMPTANPDAPEYASLAERWMQAQAGAGIEEFHAELFQNQRWSYEQGLLRRGVHISPTYSLASVDAEGAYLLQNFNETPLVQQNATTTMPE